MVQYRGMLERVEDLATFETMAEEMKQARDRFYESQAESCTSEGTKKASLRKIRRRTDAKALTLTCT